MNVCAWWEHWVHSDHREVYGSITSCGDISSDTMGCVLGTDHVVEVESCETHSCVCHVEMVIVEDVVCVVESAKKTRERLY